MAKLTDIQGISDTYAGKLESMGITSVEQLLEEGATPSGRKQIAEKTGIAASHIQRWINYSDLFRIKGIAGQFAELLEAAGVDTVPELAQRNAENLAQKMKSINEDKNLTRVVPSVPQISEWVEMAKTLPRKVHY